MSSITKPILLNETGERMANALEIIAGVQDGSIANWNTVRGNVQAGNGAKLYPVGSQFVEKWTDTVTGTEYSFVFDVVSHETVTFEDGTTGPGMVLQCHYATPFGISFSNAVPFYVVGSTALAAGTYNITFSNSWGQVAATSYQFTLTQSVPAGGVLAFAGTTPICDMGVSSWRVSSFMTVSDQNAIESVGVAVGTGGTNLGTFSASNADEAKDEYRIGAGYNRWRDSAIRQWLNSDKAKGNWWKATRTRDLRPNQLFEKDGFLRGFESDFLSAIVATKQQTAANTISDSGETDITYDKFFLPSLEQEYCSPQASGVEGTYWEYWKKVLKGSMHGQGATDVQHIRYAVENHNSARYVRLRSANRGDTGSTWNVNASGGLYSYHAITASRVCPACVVA